MAILSVQGLHHRFGRQRVLNGVDLVLDAGECGVLFGANGCGKSTLLALLSTRFRIQRGRYHLKHWDTQTEGDTVRAHLLFVGHQTHLYGHLTPLENMLFFCDLHGLRCPSEALQEAVASVGLQRFAERPIRGFSAGMKKRLALARMLLSKPQLLLLDEPYSALDQQGVTWLNRVLTDYLNQGGVVVMASHDPERVSALKHHPFHLQRGRLHPQQGEGTSC